MKRREFITLLGSAGGGMAKRTLQEIIGKIIRSFRALSSMRGFMLKFRIKRPRPDYCSLCQELVRATFDNDFETIRKLVAYDFEEFRPIKGQIGGCDGYLQHAIGLREKYPKYEDFFLSCKCRAIPKVGLFHRSRNATRVLCDLRFALLVDSSRNEVPYFEWETEFSPSGKLMNRRCLPKDNTNTSDWLVDERYPAWLDDEKLAPPTFWDHVRAVVANLGKILFALRPLILITLLLYILMILPPQSEEALRVMVQESPFLSWFAYAMSAFLLTFSMFMYGFGTLDARPLNARSGEKISTVRHVSLSIALLVIMLATLAIMVAAPLSARLTVDDKFADPELRMRLNILATAPTLALLLCLQFAWYISDDIRGKIERQPGSHSDQAWPIRIIFVIGLVCFLLPFHVTYSATLSVLAWAILIMAIFSWMAWLSTRSGLPILFIVLAWPLLLSWFNANDHHTIRYSEKTPAASPAKSAFNTWLNNRPKAAGTAKNLYPVFIVVAEGGGLRAAVMTAMVLDELRARFPCSPEGVAPVQCFQDNLFAVIGVSGGSVGAASFAAALHEGLPPRRAMQTLESHPADTFFDLRRMAISALSPDTRSLLGLAVSPSQPGNWQAALHADLLSSIVRSMLSLDLLGHYVPLLDVSIWDRSRALEYAWAQGWKEAVGRDSLRDLMFSDVAPRATGDAPNLILLTTSVENGEPVAISHLTCFGIRTISEIAPKIDVPLITAAVMSARFPVITPAALMPEAIAKSGTGQPSGYVDGGYFENSGLTTATRLIKAIQPMPTKAPTQPGDKINSHDAPAPAPSNACPPAPSVTPKPELHPELIVIRIENGGARQAALESQSRAHLFEFMSPFSALYATSDARGRQSAEAFQDFIANMQKSCVDGSDCYQVRQVPFALEAKGAPIPLDWLLSSKARQNIATQLGYPCNEKSFGEIGRALGQSSELPKGNTGLDCPATP